MGRNIAYGARKDEYDPKARYYKRKTMEVPDKLSWAATLAAIFDQDGARMCTGTGFDAHVCSDAARLGIIQPGLPLSYSPWYFYNGARKLEGTLGSDNGAYPSDVAKWIVLHGMLPYSDWPVKRDVLGNVLFDPSDPLLKESLAKKYPNRTQSRIDNGVQGMIEALTDGSFAFACPWFKSWEDYHSGVLPKISRTSAIGGGHQTMIYGYDKIKGVFLGVNSWGTDWGIRIPELGTCGGYELDFDAIEIIKQSHGGYDAHDIDFDKDEPLPVANYTLQVIGGSGSSGSGTFPSGTKAPIYAGTHSGYTFNRWTPTTNIENPFAPRTTINIIDNTVVTASFYQNKRRCNLFAAAKRINKELGL